MKLQFTGILFLFALNILSAQELVSGYVIDAETKEPIPYAYVIKVQVSGGTITNEDGYFELDCSNTDSLEISYLGYENIVIPINKFRSIKTVELNESTEILSQVTVIANDEYLYNLINQAKQNLNKQKEVKSSKAYLFTTTTENSNPIEVSEYFYNVSVEKGSIKSLQYKNGQSYLSEKESGGLFINLNISKAISMYSLINGNQYFPRNPLELSRKKLKKNYYLDLVTRGADFVQIQFTPKQNASGFFHGNIWVDLNSLEMLKIELNSVGNGNDLFRGILETKIEKLNFTLSYSYKKVQEENELQFVAIKYNADLSESKSGIAFSVKTESILHRYNFVNKFEAPKIQYPPDLADYRFLTVSRDSNVWKALQRQSQVKRSKDQHNNLHTIRRTGQNFKKVNLAQSKGFFEANYQHWSPDTRIRINTTKKRIDAIEISKIKEYAVNAASQNVIGDFLHVESVLYLDVVRKDEKIFFETAAILDPYNSFNYLEMDDRLLAYINIYYDLTEIFRRRLNDKLLDPNLSIEQVNQIYEQLNAELISWQKDLEKESDAGRKLAELSKWNSLVFESLGIDNFDIFNIMKQQ